MLDGLMQAVSQSPDQKKWLLLLAGAGILAAIGLIVLGLFVFISRNTLSSVATTTPTPTITPEAVAETPTSLAGVIIVASLTPTVIDTSVNEASDTAAAAQLPTATRIPTNTPTPQVLAPPRPPTAVIVDGAIELITPADNIQLTSDTVEFTWKWHQNKGCQPPPEGYAFEIRVWFDSNSAAPMGAMDAKLEKPNIRCDPNTGTHAFTIGKVRDVPGARGLQGGRFRWDVTLVQLDPYQPIVITPYRIFFY